MDNQPVTERMSRWFMLSFGAILSLRAVYPFLHDPTTQMVGLPKRQWTQAGSFWDPVPMGGVDSFLYQPWLALMRWLAEWLPWILPFSAALLCVLMPVAWYLACRELMPRRWAEMTGLIIAVTPSFWTIYSFFASETLLLVLMGLACWQTARCWNRKCNCAFILAGIFWFAATYTRFVALPPAVACLLVLTIRLHWPVLSLVVVSVFAIALGGFSAWHSHKALGVYAPFGMPEMNAILTRSNGPRLYIHYDGKERWFRSPSTMLRPLQPFSDWHMRDFSDTQHVHINTADGRDDWRQALEKYPRTMEFWMRQLKHNAMFLLFGPSWPEVWPDSWAQDQTPKWEEAINKHARWMWAPLIFFCLLGARDYQGPLLQRGLIMITLGMVALLLVQSTSVLEGRYRKPIEPLLIISAALLLQHRMQQKHKEPDSAVA